MDTVQFEFADTANLYCIPECGCDLNYLVERYTCFERIAIPSYETVAGCLGRAAKAGVLQLPIDCFYTLTSEWFARVHSQNNKIVPSEHAMYEIAEELEKQVWPAIGGDFVLPKPEFERAASHTKEYLDALFAPYRKNDK